MGKRKRTRTAEPAAITAELATADRHDFSAGYLGHDSSSYTVVNVSERIALAVDVVYACVRTIADAVADARWDEWRDTEQLPPSRLVRRPMATWTRRRWLWRVAATLALYNVAYMERRGTDSDGTALSLVPVVPGELRRYNGRTYIGTREVSEDAIATIHRADWPSVTEEMGSVLGLARTAFAAAWAADAYRTDFWEKGGAPALVLTTDQELNDTQATGIKTAWVTARQDTPGAPAVLGKGTHVERLGADIGAAGASDATDRLGSSIARYFGMPAWIVNVASAAGSLTYSNTESAGLDLVRYTLRGYLGPLEDALSDELPGDYMTGRTVRSDVSHLTAGTLLERFQAYAIATNNRGWMTPAEVRTLLHMPPDAGLDASGAPAPSLEVIR